MSKVYTSADVIEHYNKKTSIESGPGKGYQGIIEVRQPTMKTNYAAFANAWVPKRQATVNILDAAGLSRLTYGRYLGFSLECYKAVIVQGLSGESLAVWVAVLITKYVGRGLLQATLETIRTEVWNVGAPTP
jgi:hypothetical protein